MTSEQIVEELAKVDDQTPYISRRNKAYDDGRIYEVVRMNNADWRDVITDDQTVMGRFPNEREAEKLHDRLAGAFRVRAILTKLAEIGPSDEMEIAGGDKSVFAADANARANANEIFTAMLRSLIGER